MKTIEEDLASKTDPKTMEKNPRIQMNSIRAKLEKKMEVLRSELKAKIAESKASTIKCVAGMLVAHAALIATLVKLL